MKTIIQSEQAPLPFGPYSQAVKANGFLFLSGQIPIAPESGAVVKGSFVGQVRQVLENIKAILTTAGCTFEDVVKVTIFLTNLDNFGELNAIYSEYFSASKPARSTIQVSRLPKEVDVEIEVTALCK